MELKRVKTSNDALRSVDSFKAVIDAEICTDGSQQGLMEDCRSVIQRVLGTDDHIKVLSALPMTTGCVVSGVVAVALYTSERGVYLPLNKAMRDGEERTVLKLKPLIRDLTALLEALPRVKTVTFRGEKHLHPELRGDAITFRSFVSTSEVMYHASVNFLEGCGHRGTLFVVQGCSGRGVDFLSSKKGEAEVLFCPGKQFEVIAKMSPVVRSVLGLPYRVVTIREQGFIPTAEDVSKTMLSSAVLYEPMVNPGRFSVPMVRNVTNPVAPGPVRPFELMPSWVHGTEGPRAVLLIGPGGSGKTAAAVYLYKECLRMRLIPVFVPLSSVEVGPGSMDKFVKSQLGVDGATFE